MRIPNPSIPGLDEFWFTDGFPITTASRSNRQNVLPSRVLVPEDQSRADMRPFVEYLATMIEGETHPEHILQYLEHGYLSLRHEYLDVEVIIEETLDNQIDITISGEWESRFHRDPSPWIAYSNARKKIEELGVENPEVYHLLRGLDLERYNFSLKRGKNGFWRVARTYVDTLVETTFSIDTRVTNSFPIRLELRPTYFNSFEAKLIDTRYDTEVWTFDFPNELE